MEKRTFEIDIGKIRSDDDRTVEATLSTTFPVKRFDGQEVLSHHPDHVDLSRQPLPLIAAHDTNALPVGVVEGLRLVGDKLKGLLRISSTKNEIWEDIKDGILRNLSIGYFVSKREKQKGGFLVTGWQPYECSLVAAGADPSAGIGRSFKPRKENRKMDYNDILKAKKRAADELEELALTENLDETASARFDELKGEIRTLDSRLEALEMAQGARESLAGQKTFKPDLKKKQDRSILNFQGGPAVDRSYAGMFNQGREIEIDEGEVREFVRTMVSGTPSAGGFSVPDPLSAKWLDDSLPNEVIRPRATVWPMTSSSLRVPGWDSTDQQTDLYGGFALEFIAETGQATKQTGKMRLITLVAKKGAIFADISNELKEDGTGFESQLEMAIKKSLGLGMDYYFLRGSGAGQPLGVTVADSLISITKEGGQDNATIVWENIVKMYARMYPAGRSNSIWLGNETIIPQLLQLHVAVGFGGDLIQPLQESDGSFTLLGRPVVFTPNLPTLGNASDLLFVDLTQYAVGLRKELVLEKSNVPGWVNDLMSYRVICRFDGMPTWDSEITPRNGDTLSWCVSLGARQA